MRKQINPLVAVVVVIVAVLGVGLLIFKMAGTSDPEKQVVVKPANPDDPKFHPNPKLGLAGPGTEKGGSND